MAKEGRLWLDNIRTRHYGNFCVFVKCVCIGVWVWNSPLAVITIRQGITKYKRIKDGFIIKVVNGFENKFSNLI